MGGAGEFPTPPINERLRDRLQDELQQIILAQIKEDGTKVGETIEDRVSSSSTIVNENVFCLKTGDR